ncbi:uncharacterized protein B0H18DRAFT_1015226 [Fomitopsis serialis]|uniref:uncharacterized protein n=1 Tax=Fomitopsis serialis TaxID=139415 RepID=UPI0020083425|nr:uncharacterized protein B0H18DRAFT_1015226 [Neoantrodia serialis]KAH9923564.1 hypothetical protein B0H18DRAFT_1015226 [Neoantrodia serialis]
METVAPMQTSEGTRSLDTNDDLTTEEAISRSSPLGSPASVAVCNLPGCGSPGGAPATSVEGHEPRPPCSAAFTVDSSTLASTGDDLSAQDELLLEALTDDAPVSEDASSDQPETPVKPGRRRHPRARGGKKVQAAKARKIARQAADAAAAAAKAGTNVSGSVTADTATDAGESEVEEVDVPPATSFDVLAIVSQLPSPVLLEDGPSTLELEEGRLLSPSLQSEEARPPSQSGLDGVGSPPPPMLEEDRTLPTSSPLLAEDPISPSSNSKQDQQPSVCVRDTISSDFNDLDDGQQAYQGTQVCPKRKPRHPLRMAVKAAVAAAVVKQSHSLRASRILECKTRSTANKLEPTIAGPLDVSSSPSPSLTMSGLDASPYGNAAPPAPSSPMPHPESCLSQGPELGSEHYALLRTLFPCSEAVPHEGQDIRPSSPQDTRSVSSGTLVPHDLDVDSDTTKPDSLADDLLATHRELKSLRDTVSSLLVHMDMSLRQYRACDVRGPASLVGTWTPRASTLGSEGRRGGQPPELGSLMGGLEKISVLTVRLAAAVRSELVCDS